MEGLTKAITELTTSPPG